MGTKIEIGAGFVVTAPAGFGLLQSLPASYALLVIGVILILHGVYEIFFKPRMFLQKRIVKWLISRNWRIKVERDERFFLIIRAEDDSHRDVVITRDKIDKDILAFTSPVHIEQDWKPRLDKLTERERAILLEDIKVFFASRDMSYEVVRWPLDNLAVQHALPLDYQVSEHLVDVKAKSVINSAIGVRSIIRKAIIPSQPALPGSRT